MRIGLFINKRKEKLSLVIDILFKYFSKDEIVFLNELEFISTQYEMCIDELNQHNIPVQKKSDLHERETKKAKKSNKKKGRAQHSPNFF